MSAMQSHKVGIAVATQSSGGTGSFHDYSTLSSDFDESNALFRVRRYVCRALARFGLLDYIGSMSI